MGANYTVRAGCEAILRDAALRANSRAELTHFLHGPDVLLLAEDRELQRGAVLRLELQRRAECRELAPAHDGDVVREQVRLLHRVRREEDDASGLDLRNVLPNETPGRTRARNVSVTSARSTSS